MPPFFDQLSGNQSHGGISDLETERQYFRLHQTSGIIEAQITPSTHLTLVLARGVLAGAYILNDEESTPVILSEVLQGWADAPIAIRGLPLPDTVARLLWLALDSQRCTSMKIRDKERWQDWLIACQEQQISALVEIQSEQFNGLLCISRGQIIETESIYLLNGEFQADPPPTCFGLPYKLCTYKPRHESQAWQCLHLRSGAGKWLQHALHSYQEIAGHRLARFAKTAMRQSIETWDWNLDEQNNRISDKHFFPSLGLAADAYRSLLMSMGKQMEIVIGHRLTQRILDQAFERILSIEQSVLESQRLIPAAFVG